MPEQGHYRRYRKIADNIADRIHSGRYPSGSRLPSERELVEEFGISRPSLREALIALELMGFVTVRGGSGIYVNDQRQHHSDIDPGIGTFEILEARLIIEADTAAIAARSITKDLLADLRNQVTLQIDSLAMSGRYPEETDKRFHLIIAEATGNGALLSVVEWLWRVRQNSGMWRLIDERADAQAMQSRAVDEHVAILAAIDHRDPKAAHHAMQRHIQSNINWRLVDGSLSPTVSDQDHRTKLRLLNATPSF